MISNVFVVGTGRCGTTTFIQACNHIVNFTAGHETRITKFGESRFKYSRNHIEADNRLSWMLPDLIARFPDSVLVHLRRDVDDVAKSYSKRRGPRSLADNLIRGILYQADVEQNRQEVLKFGMAVLRNNVDYILKRVNNKVYFIDIEYPNNSFIDFWNYIGAKGDIIAALDCFNYHFNQS